MREEQIEVVEAEIVTVAEDSGEDDGTGWYSFQLFKHVH